MYGYYGYGDGIYLIALLVIMVLSLFAQGSVQACRAQIEAFLQKG